MSTSSPATSALVEARSTANSPEATHDRARRRAIIATAAITAAAIYLFADLLLAGHTRGGQIWGPITAATATLTGVLSLAFMARRGRSRAARIGLIALWLTVAFLGFGGYNDHRLPVREGSADTRPRPPLAPLVFTGMGLAGTVVLRTGTRGD